MTAIPIERIKEVLTALDSYELDEDLELDISNLPEWPNEPEANSPAWVAMRIVQEVVNDEHDYLTVYTGYTAARSAIVHIIGMAESPAT